MTPCLYQAFRELGCVIRTIFLLRYISDLPMREQISNVTNILERYNQFCRWILFGGEGVIAENDPEEQQKRVRYTDILANALMLQNVADLSEALQKLEQSGYPINPEDVVRLSPYLTRHIQRFGDYVLKGWPAAPFPNEETLSPDPLAGSDIADDELSA